MMTLRGDICKDAKMRSSCAAVMRGYEPAAVLDIEYDAPLGSLNMPQLMGRLETLASLHMASSDCVNCMCSPFHSPGWHAAEGLQINEKIQCD